MGVRLLCAREGVKGAWVGDRRGAGQARGCRRGGGGRATCQGKKGMEDFRPRPEAGVPTHEQFFPRRTPRPHATPPPHTHPSPPMATRCSPGGASTSAPSAAGRPRSQGTHSSARRVALARLPTAAAAPARRGPAPPSATAASAPHGPRQMGAVGRPTPGRTGARERSRGEEGVFPLARERHRSAPPPPATHPHADPSPPPPPPFPLHSPRPRPAPARRRLHGRRPGADGGKRGDRPGRGPALPDGGCVRRKKRRERGERERERERESGAGAGASFFFLSLSTHTPAFPLSSLPSLPF